MKAKKAVFAHQARLREWRRQSGQEEVKVTFGDVKEAHLNSKCCEDQWVEPPNDFRQLGRYARLDGKTTTRES